MFPKVCKGSSKQYVTIVESYRDANGKPKQRQLYNLGPVTEETKEQKLNLARAIIANLDGSKIITGIDGIKETSRVNWGAPQIIDKMWDKFLLNSQFQSCSSGRVQAIKLMLADRLISPCSKLSTYNKRDFYEGGRDVKLEQMYRALDDLSDNCESIKQHLMNQRKDSGIEVVFFDVTTLYFESQKADLLREFGYSKDCKFNEVQVVLCLLIDSNGAPLTFEVFAGNTFEGATLVPVLSKLKQAFKINKIIIVADRGIGSASNLAQIKSAGYEYIIGARLRSATKSIQEDALNEKGFELLSQSDSDTRQYKFIENNEQKWVIVHSTARARKDQRDRQKFLEKAKEFLESGASINNAKGAKKFIKMPKANKSEMSLDTQKIEQDQRFDGYYAISYSDESMSAAQILSAYHGLWKIEESFRTLKNLFEVRPMFHWTKKRIEGHILLNFILLVFEYSLLYSIKQLDSSITHASFRNKVLQMEFSSINIDGRNFAVYANLQPLHINILRALNIPIPKNHPL